MIKKHRTAIVTGTSRGVGVHIAKALANEGIDLVLAARTVADLDRVAKEIQAVGVKAIAVPTDIRELDDLKKLVSTAERQFGSIDILVNNAAIESVLPFHKEGSSTIDEMINTNLNAPIQLSRLVIPGMLDRGRGHIVNISGLLAKIPFPYDVVFSASKAGLAHFTSSLRAEYRQSGVSASVILAGIFTNAGSSAQMSKESGVQIPKSVPTSQPETAGKAVIKAIQKDLHEVAIPGPALLFTRIPALGTLFLKTTGAINMMKQVAGVRAQLQDAQ